MPANFGYKNNGIENRSGRTYLTALHKVLDVLSEKMQKYGVKKQILQATTNGETQSLPLPEISQ